ncbi:hypothetical protein SAMN04488101_102763 [Pedobacter nyackensis]|uniref:Uncharacterized protein n=1 Tax=Pedobacter nyackensis TaxID=475255 RepID=A0A1W2BSF4_9SPHI|nr:hypothetical protein SAMN04488101_102763 [Pedobacter nyackensis]
MIFKFCIDVQNKNIKIGTEIKTFEMCKNLFFFALNYLTIKL